MNDADEGTVFLVGVPGLETPLLAEAAACGFSGLRQVPGGVEMAGGLADAAEANLRLRCAVRVLWRIASFRAMHPAQLDKRARKVDWRAVLRPDVPVRVEAVCRRSKIYVNKAAISRIAGAIEAAGIPVAKEAEVVIKARIEDDLCTISVDTSGEPLHRRGHKEFVGKAPLRETMAAGFLHEMGFDGSQCVVDPMCGSGTIPIEATEIAARLLPGRSRSFAFEQLVDGTRPTIGHAPMPDLGICAYGMDRNDGAIRGAQANAARAGIADLCTFQRQAISDLEPPTDRAGIVLVNPPYGGRIGDRKLLFGLYGALGGVLSERFAGWRIGIITSDGGLAKATGLDLTPMGPVDHSGTKVQLWRRLP
ncbi:MAG: class I SAM-dependent RNA methyltransferase [Octadecabacter sp.]|nr:class I SAM-dependent RNA methyltransferase [Octadecabacter sp.]